MAYKATSTIGTLVKHKPAGGSFALVEGVQSISGPGATKGTTEVQGIDKNYKIFKGNRADYGKMSFEANFDPNDASHVALLTAFNTTPAADSDFEIALMDNGSEPIGFTAFIDNFGITIPNEGPVMLKTGASLTSAIADVTAATVTASETYDGCVGQGTVFSLKVSSTYTQINGVLDGDISGGARNRIAATPIDSLAAQWLAGLVDNGKFAMNILYDSTDDIHQALKDAYAAESQVDSIQITLTSTPAKSLQFDIVVDGWEWDLAKESPNKVKVSGRVNSLITIA